MVRLFLIRGLPGSGKSTLALGLKKLRESLGEKVSHFEADMYHIWEGKYEYVPENAAMAHAWCLDSTKKALANGETVIVSNTSLNADAVLPYVLAGLNAGVKVQLILCKGSFQNVHEVPGDVLETMRESLVEFPDSEFVFDVVALESASRSLDLCLGLIPPSVEPNRKYLERSLLNKCLRMPKAALDSIMEETKAQKGFLENSGKSGRMICVPDHESPTDYCLSFCPRGGDKAEYPVTLIWNTNEKPVDFLALGLYRAMWGFCK